MKNELKEIFGVLILFFCLTVVSLVMVFSNFESYAEEFWSEQQEIIKAANALAENDIFNSDNSNTSGGVDENAENSTLSK